MIDRVTYLLFAGVAYYPSGGVQDFRGEFRTLEEAMAASPPGHEIQDWAHVAVREDDGRLRIVAWRDREEDDGGWKDGPSGRIEFFPQRAGERG